MTSTREIFGLWKPLPGVCCVCGAEAVHNHFDRVQRDLICTGCWEPLVVVEIECAVWLTNPPREREVLRLAIMSFERAHGRVIKPFVRPEE